MIDHKLLRIITEYMADGYGDRGHVRVEKGNCWADFTSVRSDCRCPKMDTDVAMHIDSHAEHDFSMTKITMTRQHPDMKMDSLELTDLVIAQASKKELRTMLDGLAGGLK